MGEVRRSTIALYFLYRINRLQHDMVFTERLKLYGNEQVQVDLEEPQTNQMVELLDTQSQQVGFDSLILLIDSFNQYPGARPLCEH